MQQKYKSKPTQINTLTSSLKQSFTAAHSPNKSITNINTSSNPGTNKISINNINVSTNNLNLNTAGINLSLFKRVATTTNSPHHSFNKKIISNLRNQFDEITKKPRESNENKGKKTLENNKLYHTKQNSMNNSFNILQSLNKNKRYNDKLKIKVFSNNINNIEYKKKQWYQWMKEECDYCETENLSVESLELDSNDNSRRDKSKPRDNKSVEKVEKPRYMNRKIANNDTNNHVKSKLKSTKKQNNHTRDDFHDARKEDLYRSVWVNTEDYANNNNNKIHNHTCVTVEAEPHREYFRHRNNEKCWIKTHTTNNSKERRLNTDNNISYKEKYEEMLKNNNTLNQENQWLFQENTQTKKWLSVLSGIIQIQDNKLNIAITKVKKGWYSNIKKTRTHDTENNEKILLLLDENSKLKKMIFELYYQIKIYEEKCISENNDTNRKWVELWNENAYLRKLNEANITLRKDSRRNSTNNNNSFFDLENEHLRNRSRVKISDLNKSGDWIDNNKSFGLNSSNSGEYWGNNSNHSNNSTCKYTGQFGNSNLYLKNTMQKEMMNNINIGNGDNVLSKSNDKFKVTKRTVAGITNKVGNKYKQQWKNKIVYNCKGNNKK